MVEVSFCGSFAKAVTTSVSLVGNGWSRKVSNPNWWLRSTVYVVFNHGSVNNYVKGQNLWIRYAGTSTDGIKMYPCSPNRSGMGWVEYWNNKSDRSYWGCYAITLPQGVREFELWCGMSFGVKCVFLPI